VKTSRGTLNFVETRRYDDGGKIIERRAYYDPADMQPHAYRLMTAS
jgi:hypothetical protein